MLIADIEANGLLDEATKVHVLGIKDTIHGVSVAFRNNKMADGLGVLARSDQQVVMHNGIKYDLPVLHKLYGFGLPQHRIVDTLVLSRLVYPDLADRDYRRKDFPPRLIGSHSLEAWGYRLGIHKGEYSGGWEEWNSDMEDYCIQDLEVTEALYNHLMEQGPSIIAQCIEHRVATIVSRQERYGFLFDNHKAVALYGKLSQRKHELEVELQAKYGYIYKRDGKPKAYKKPGKKLSEFTAGVLFQPLKYVPFNPGSRDDIIYVLTRIHGWKPMEFTDSGKPKVDETSLDGMSFETAPLFKEYFLVTKRIGQVAEGNKAWLKLVKPDGRIHGSVNTNGAVTGRMTHADPNVAQTPAGYSPYGHDCRECFCVPPGKLQVGADAAALELRDLAGYMAKFDGGAYVNTVVNGRKEDGTEMHTVNRKALEIDSRDDAKTWFYAFIYGAGDEKLGSIVLKTSAERRAHWENNPSAHLLYEQRRHQRRPVTRKQAALIDRGSKDREKFLRNIPALGELTKRVQEKAKKQGYLIGLDGRKLFVRGQHSALNTLLQSAGAVQMKLALIILDDSLQAQGFRPGIDYEFVANVHDEWQLEVREEIADVVGRTAVDSIRRAGAEFGFGCPLDGEYKVGRNWAETH